MWPEEWQMDFTPPREGDREDGPIPFKGLADIEDLLSTWPTIPFAHANPKADLSKIQLLTGNINFPASKKYPKEDTTKWYPTSDHSFRR